MAKVTKASPAKPEKTDSGTGEDKPARKAKVNHYASGSVALSDDIKLPPQERIIVELIQGSGKDGISRADLLKLMEGKVTTRQPLERILGYYQNDMVNRELVTVEKREAA